MNKKRIAIIFVAAIFSSVFSACIVAIADESEMVPDTDAQEQPSYTDNPGEIGDIARRAEAQIQEINETSELEKQKLETVKREQYFEDNKVEPAVTLLSKDDIARLEAERLQKENAIRTKVDYEIQSLEAGQTTQQEVSPAGSGPRPMLQTSARGMVTGIVFCNNGGAALVAGEIVRENDKVLDVKVLKVTPHYVEFEKQGSKWKQVVGEAPPVSYWGLPQTQKPATPQRPSVPTKTKTGKDK